MSEDVLAEFDQPRRLKLSLKAAKALSRSCEGHGLLHVNQKLMEFDIDTLERVMWASMLEDEPNLTLSLTVKRVEAYWEREKTLAPLFLLAARAIEASGLFSQPAEESSGKTAAVQAT